MLRQRSGEKRVEIRVAHWLVDGVIARTHGGRQLRCLAGARTDGFGAAALEQASRSSFVPEEQIKSNDLFTAGV